MRGFTMLLVVMAHVGTFGMNLHNPEIFTYQNLFSEFRMPLFFFVSGFVLYKAGFVWNYKNTIAFLKKKISVQIIAPLLFMLAFLWVHNIDILPSFIDPSKYGYWFTFALFELYLFYIVINQILDLFKLSDGLARDIWLSIAGVCLYLTLPLIVYFAYTNEIIGFFGGHYFHYFLFFVLGTRIRKHFNTFENILDKTHLITISIIVYIAINLFDKQLDLIFKGIVPCLTSLSGLVIILFLFRKNAKLFSHEHAAGRVLQFIGRRTLDIYLIHYFFVCSNMEAVLPDFGQLNSPFLGLVIQVFIAALVVAACLAVSCVLRLSPFIAHFCFGQKYKQQ